MNVLTDDIEAEAQDQGSDASSVYDTKSMGLGNNTRTLIFLVE